MSANGRDYAPTQGSDVTGQPAGTPQSTAASTAQQEIAPQTNVPASGQAPHTGDIAEVAGTLAHDLSNILTVILGHSEMLLRRLQPEDPAWQQAKLICKMGERAGVLTRQLLTLSKQHKARPVVMDVNTVVRDMEPLLQRQLRAGTQLTVVLDPTLQAIEADPAQIERVLLNLVLNARDAMPQGGQLRIETGNALLDDAGAAAKHDSAPGYYVRMTVSDTGCGMTDEVRSRLFDPFFTTKKADEGTGLGLFIVSWIVRQCGGRIEVTSHVGQGTVFRILLPCSAKGYTRPASSGAFPALAGGAETILVADGDDYVREMVRQALSACGYTVLTAGNAGEALALAGRQSAPIHLLLADVMLAPDPTHCTGVHSGSQLAEELRQQNRNLKVVFMSGRIDEHDSAHSLPGVGVELLRKPVSLSLLARKVRQMLDAPVKQ